MENTKAKFKEWLKNANYKDLVEMYQTYKLKLIEYRSRISKEGRLYSMQSGPTSKMENIRMVKYKYNLLTNKLNLITLKGGK
jgi:hypothetical protein